jgi:hypothetical protein
MTLAGGTSDKLGNRYEGRWTVLCMVDVMDEKADSIRLEPPGIDGIEFFLRRKDKLEYHQVKRQRSGRGRWTLNALEDKQVQVLSDFWKSLSNPDVSCVFISTQDADELQRLAMDARDAASGTEFEQKYLNKTLAGHFHTLCQKWGNCSEIEAYKALKRVRVETVGEDLLVNFVENRIEVLVEGDPKTIRIELAELAQDRPRQELTTHNIWHYLLKERGYRRREWGKDPHVLAAVDKVNDRYLSRLHKEAIAGKVILRDDVDIILDKLTSQDAKRGVLVAGEAGVGKSGVILQAVEALLKQGVPIIAFRVDGRLEPTDSPDQVGEQLENLPGSPAHVLANIAQGRDCVLVIDQLDAVSTASGRNPQFFECIDRIIDQAKAYPQMRILLACRKFDLDYDYRLKRLTGENGIADTVTISRLSHEKVREVVAELGLNSSLLNNKQLELLSIPLHLRRLAEVPEVSKANALNFRTAKDLYDKFWNHKKDVINARLGNSEHWADVIYTLCDYMSKQQRLSAPKARVDRYGKTAEWMASEQVLILDGQQYSFFHEGFFDYAFARRFAGEDEELLSFLGSREQQHLFRRAQVRQILLYERDAERDRYLTDLKALLTSSDVRFHIKKVVFALLAALDDPTQEELEIIALLIGNQADPITQQVWQTLRSSVHWFRRLDELGIIEQWLRDEGEERIEQTVTLLSIMQRQIPDRVAELVEPYVSASAAWRARLVYLVQRADLNVGGRFFDLFLRLIDEGILDEKANTRDFWLDIYSLPEKCPERTCEIIGHYLNRRLELILDAVQSSQLHNNPDTIPNIQLDDRIVLESASGAPLSFVTQVLPYILRAIELTARQEGEPPWRDPVWGFREYGLGYGSQRVLLSAMEAALSNLAANHPEDFASIAEEVCKSKFETIQYLLIHAYTANGSRFADEAVDYLCENPKRLGTGYSICTGNANAAPFWATRKLLEAITPHCSEEQMARIERVILNYYPDWEKSAHGRRSRGYAQLVLLEGIAPSQRTNEVNRRLQEWKREFTDVRLLKPPGKIETPKSSQAWLIKSPIPEKAADKMTNEQWLRAIARYDYDDAGSRFERTGEVIGGAYQLSSLLESQVKKEPVRFAELIWRFPNNARSSYFDAVLRGIAEIGLDVEAAFRVCQRCHQLPNRPCGRSITWLIEKLAELPWLEEAFDIVTWYALEDPDPEQEWWRTETSSGQVYYGGNILEAGINSTRGSAVGAIAALIFADKNRTSYFRQSLQQIVQDPSIAVRACAAEALIAVLNYDRDLAVTLFQQLCETEEALLGTQTVEQFLYYALQTHFEALAAIVERMIMSELSEVAKVGARQACLISLIREEARWLAEVCLSGTEAHKKAAAEIFVTNLRSAHFRKFCENALIQLFHDSSQEVRSQAARCFLRSEREQLGEYLSLVEAFVDSPAFTTDPKDLIHALEKTTAKLPDAATYRVCDRFLEDLRSDDAEVRDRGIFRADRVSKLLVQLYRKTKDQALQSRCLELIDLMSQMEVYGLTEALTQFER